MKVLVAGFPRADMDLLSTRLRDAGHSVLGASGRSSARILAQGASPEAVLVPDGPRGEEAAGWIADLLPGVPVHRAARAGDILSEADGSEDVPAATPTATRTGTAPSGRAAAAARVVIDHGPASDGAEAPPTASSLTPPAPPVAAAPDPVVPAVPAPVEAPKPTAQLPSAEAGGRGASRQRLETLLAHVRFGDYHAVLDVKPEASAFVVRQSYERLRGVLTPTTWSGPLGPADIPLLDEIARGVEDAWSVLGHAERRARYERALKASGRSHHAPSGR